VWWRVTAIVIAGVLAYANSLSSPFIFDDEATIVENRAIRTLPSSAVFLPERELPTAGRPIVNFSFAINYAIGGMDVRGYHVANLALHLLCALVLFALVRHTCREAAALKGPPYDSPAVTQTFVGRAFPPSLKLRRTAEALAEAGQARRTTAALKGLPYDNPQAAALKGPRCDALDLALAVALIWTLHPLNTEVVDYITQRTESMMALCYLITLYASARAVRLKPDTTAGMRSGSTHLWSGIAIVACALGMACKESMVTAPVMVILYDRVFVFDSFKKALRARGPLYAGLAATWIVLAAVNWSGSRIHSAGFGTGVSVWTYLLNQSVMVVRYVRLAFWPHSLVLAYGTPLPISVGDALPYALIVLALLGLTLFALWRHPVLGFLGAWFFITLAPTTSIVPIATEVGAERRMYLALAAVVTLAVVTLSPLLRRQSGAVVLAVVCLALAVGTISRNREYQSSLTMAETVLERWPTPFAHAMVGLELAKLGRHDEAIAHLRQGADRYPKAGYHLGGELFNQGRHDEAYARLAKFVEQEPFALEAVRARLMMGRALLPRREYPTAIEQFRLVLSMTARDDDSHTIAIGLMADALFGQDRFDEAAKYYRGYLAAKPDDISARGNLAKTLFNKGDVDGAAAEARAILRIRDDAVARDLLGRALASQGKLDEAQQEFERALRIDPNFQPARDDLAMIRRASR
jgi:tetratricopeptide (TPR) repeat protein